MFDHEPAFTLHTSGFGAPAPVLTAVRAHGRLEGVLFELSLRQAYRNASDDMLEVVYTFPLPPQAVLLGFASELNGRRLQGRIVAKAQAESDYESALADGDAPVMLEALPDGLYTANLGNLKPGDEVVLEVRYAELLAFDQGRLRLAIPTTIAPRYGSPVHAGLQPQQVPQASLDAEYPFELAIEVGPALAGAALECPTHRMHSQAAGGGRQRLELLPGAVLDRDVVVLVTPREPRPSLVVAAADGSDTVLLAALQPLPATAARRVAVKLLVDCSGSMAGDSIASARAALRGVFAALGEFDVVGLSRFGDRVEHLLPPRPLPAARGLDALIEGLQADLGGTAMEAALRAVFVLPCPAGAVPAADVLLITDGQIWQAAEMVDAARRSGHRVFAIGVGSAPVEGALRGLAEATGGACEFVTPNEAVASAAQRMLQRMRQPAWSGVRVDWGAPVLWQTALPAAAFGGDTVTAFAAFAARPPHPAAVRLLARDAAGAEVELARGEAQAPAGPGDSLARLAAVRRLADSPQGAASLSLALRYQLMSADTSCILVHLRAAGEKATGGPTRMQRVNSMLAAGWGGAGSIGSGGVTVRACALPYTFVDAFSDVFSARYETTRSTRRFESLAHAVVEFVARCGDGAGLSAFEPLLAAPHELQQAIDRLTQLGLTADQAWLVFALWALGDDAGLQGPLAGIDATLVGRGVETLDGLLPGAGSPGQLPGTRAAA